MIRHYPYLIIWKSYRKIFIVLFYFLLFDYPYSEKKLLRNVIVVIPIFFRWGFFLFKYFIYICCMNKLIDNHYIEGTEGNYANIHLYMDKSFRVVEYHRDNRGMVWKMDTEDFTYFYYSVYYNEYKNGPRKMKVFKSKEKMIEFVLKITKHVLHPSHKFLHLVP